MAILHLQVLPHKNHPSNSMKKTHHDASDDHHDAAASSDAESSTTSSSSTWSSSSTVVATTNDASSSSSPAGKKLYKQQQRHNIKNDNNKATKVPSRRRPRKHSHNNKKTSPTLPSPPRRTCYALDCEMVGVGFDGLDSILARVTLVGWDGMVVYDAYVTPTEPVVDYRTYVSGITSEILERHGQPFAKVRSDVQQLLRGMNGGDDDEEDESDNDNDRAALLVGHALKNDLRALQLDHPWHLVRDTAKYPPYQQKTSSSCPRKAAPRKLADLARDKLGRNIQIPGQPHCPIEDALAALDLYKAERKTWERVVEYNVRKTEEIVRLQQQQNLQLQQSPLEQPPQLPTSLLPSAE